jgi:CRP/FNR family cyclic AMP-dependent transcriptional regulator
MQPLRVPERAAEMPTTQRIDPTQFLATDGEGRNTARYKAGDVIFKQGEPATLVYYLQNGRAKETIVSTEGKQVMVNILDRGRFFGISGIFNSQVRNSTVTVISTSTITAISTETMRNQLMQPDFAIFFMDYLIEQNSALVVDKVDLLLSSRPKRLAHLLIALSQTGAGVIGSEITQEMLAAMLGTSRPYVNEILNGFRVQGLIKYNGGIKVMQPAMLAWLSKQQS